ncbi:MAG: tetratricopeptide repeat protein [Acidobacteria bacterium]|nr:tetratricopeptide repeat protein [Acidobacteriota bacterium]
MKWTLRIGLAVLLGAISAAAAFADTIVLKSGRRINATSVVEEGDHVFYETKAGRLSLKKELIARIERGGFSSFGPGELPVPPPQITTSNNFDAIQSAVTEGGSINRTYIAQLESEASTGDARAAERVALAHHAAAILLVKKGEVQPAIEHYRRGLTFAPQHLGLLLSIAYLQLRESKYSQALEYLERARRVAPDDPDVSKLAGWANYGANKIDQAVKEWKRSYSLRPDVEVEQALEKARRDQQEEATYRENESSHFNLRYNGEAAPQLAREVLHTLEAHFRAIESELNYTPPDSIGVILYTAQAYTDITRAPAWAGALNDGRIRVPVQGLTSVTSELSRSLKHELVHSFVNQKTRGRCPTWLNEGIAQWMEGKRSEEGAAAFVEIFEKQRRTLSLQVMEGSWTSLPSEGAAAFYAWSLAVTEYIIQRQVLYLKKQYGSR